MKIKSIKDLRSKLHKTTVILFLSVSFFVYMGLFIVHIQFVKRQSFFDQQEIMHVIKVYRSNLAESLSIIAGSNIFQDYLRSGVETRSNMYVQFLSQLSLLRSNSIVGMIIEKSDSQVIFSYGTKSDASIKLSLCYINQMLEPSMGECDYSWILFLDRKRLFQDLLLLNKEMKPCADCRPINFINNGRIGQFSVTSYSPLYFNLKIANNKDYFFYIYFYLMTMMLLFFFLWSWLKISILIDKYISGPIKTLAACLRSQLTVDYVEQIEEINCLIDGINGWKLKLSKIQADAHSIKLAEIAAHLAHDIRSPLMVIDMIISNFSDNASNDFLVIRQASQRISNIANEFLEKYRCPSLSTADEILNEYVPGLLQDIITEKRVQYLDRKVNLTLKISEESFPVFSAVNSSDFKRVLSNLVNNSVEAIGEVGNVNISLNRKNDLLSIEIVDDGCGIPNDLLPKILAEGCSYGKKGGYGLGLSHAIKLIERWHGKLEIKSKENIGTTVSVSLPVSAKIPIWFNEKINIRSGMKICVIGIDVVSQVEWKERFSDLIENNIIDVLFFNSKDEVVESSRRVDLSNAILFFYYDFNLEGASGLLAIKNIGFIEKSVLLVDFYNNTDFQLACLNIGIKLIPKNFLQYIPIDFN